MILVFSFSENITEHITASRFTEFTRAHARIAKTKMFCMYLSSTKSKTEDKMYSTNYNPSYNC